VRFTREQPGTVSIRAIGDGEIRIGEAIYTSPVALTAEAVLGGWTATAIADLEAAHFSELIAREPELIVLGTGATSQFPPRELVFALARQAIGFEAMNSAAAARTFNVLASEGRKVAAVLYP
jgi:uncharacterized protein